MEVILFGAQMMVGVHEGPKGEAGGVSQIGAVRSEG
jgi:hypothetical protein